MQDRKLSDGRRNQRSKEQRRLNGYRRLHLTFIDENGARKNRIVYVVDVAAKDARLSNNSRNNDRQPNPRAKSSKGPRRRRKPSVQNQQPPPTTTTPRFETTTQTPVNEEDSAAAPKASSTLKSTAAVATSANRAKKAHGTSTPPTSAKTTKSPAAEQLSRSSRAENGSTSPRPTPLETTTPSTTPADVRSHNSHRSRPNSAAVINNDVSSEMIRSLIRASTVSDEPTPARPNATQTQIRNDSQTPSNTRYSLFRECADPDASLNSVSTKTSKATGAKGATTPKFDATLSRKTMTTSMPLTSTNAKRKTNAKGKISPKPKTTLKEKEDVPGGELGVFVTKASSVLLSEAQRESQKSKGELFPQWRRSTGESELSPQRMRGSEMSTTSQLDPFRISMISSSYFNTRASSDSYIEYVRTFLQESSMKLSAASIKIIQWSWRNVKMLGFPYFGHLLFSYWLVEQPRALDIFCMYYHGSKKKDVVSLLPRFRRVGENFAKRMDVWINTLNDPTRLFLMLYEHGFNHAKRRLGITEKDFTLMIPSIMDALATAIGPQMTSKLYEQWMSFWKFIFGQVAEGMRGYYEETNWDDLANLTTPKSHRLVLMPRRSVLPSSSAVSRKGSKMTSGSFLPKGSVVPKGSDMKGSGMPKGGNIPKGSTMPKGRVMPKIHE